MFDRRQDSPEAILRVGQVVQYTNAKSEVKDTRLERQVMNIALDDVAIFSFDSVVSRYFDPLAEVETHHFCPGLLRTVKKSPLATTDVGAHFALEKISFSPFHRNRIVKNLPPAREFISMIIQFHVLIAVAIQGPRHPLIGYRGCILRNKVGMPLEEVTVKRDKRSSQRRR